MKLHYILRCYYSLNNLVYWFDYHNIQQLLDLRYPDYIVLGEISKLKEKGLVLPYQGLFDAYYEKFTHSGMEVVVDNYLKKAAKEQYSAKQIVIKLRTFGYPDEFMARFLDQHIDLDLPFEE